MFFLRRAGIVGCPSSPGEDYRGFVRCPGVRDPAQARPEDIRSRWRVAGRDRSRPFMTRALADSYHAELVRAARKGLAFDLATGQPAGVGCAGAGDGDLVPARGAYAQVKWPRLAPRSRPAWQTRWLPSPHCLPGRPAAGPRREAARRPCTGTPSTRRCDRVSRPGYRQRAGLAATRVAAGQPAQRPHITRAALDGLCVRLDGSPAAANTITRKRTVFHGALGYAGELGLLPANPAGLVRWSAPKSRRGHQPGCRAQPGAGPGDPGRGLPDPVGSGRVLRLPVLCGAAPGRSRRRAPR
jgi:hypothetical protein